MKTHFLPPGDRRTDRQSVQSGNEAEGKRHQLCAEEWAGLTQDSEWEQEVVVEKRVKRTLGGGHRLCEGAESQLRQHRSSSQNWARFSSSFPLRYPHSLLHFPSPCHRFLFTPSLSFNPHDLTLIFISPPIQVYFNRNRKKTNLSKLQAFLTGMVSFL